MIAVIQRMFGARVFADGELSGEAGRGLYILLGVESGDSEREGEILLEKILRLRIFSDENGKMNLSVLDVGGDLLVVSNFTLLANYAHGNRPDYLSAEAPARANKLYEDFVRLARERVARVGTGSFGADMRTELVTDGPVTIVMDSKKLGGKRT